MEVGFVGLGNMGRPMATNILENGHKLVVWDISPDATDELVKLGAVKAKDLETLARTTSVAFLSLPNEQIVAEVICGPGGLVSGSSPGFTVFDLSTVSPASTVSLSKMVAPKGLTLIDSPVTGSVSRARNGTLTLMIGSTKESVAQFRPVLDSIGSHLMYMDSLGVGNTIKLLNNLVSLSNQAALCEALALSDHLGLQREMVCQVLGKGSANSFILESKQADLCAHDYSPGFFIDLACKDLDLVLDMASSAGARLNLGKQVRDIYVDASRSGFGKLDGTGLLALLEPQAANRAL